MDFPFLGLSFTVIETQCALLEVRILRLPMSAVKITRFLNLEISKYGYLRKKKKLIGCHDSANIQLQISIIAAFCFVVPLLPGRYSRNHLRW